MGWLWGFTKRVYWKLDDYYLYNFYVFYNSLIRAKLKYLFLNKSFFPNHQIKIWIKGQLYKIAWGNSGRKSRNGWNEKKISLLSYRGIISKLNITSIPDRYVMLRESCQVTLNISCSRNSTSWPENYTWIIYLGGKKIWFMGRKHLFKTKNFV